MVDEKAQRKAYWASGQTLKAWPTHAVDREVHIVVPGGDPWHVVCSVQHSTWAGNNFLSQKFVAKVKPPMTDKDPMTTNLAQVGCDFPKVF